MSTQSIMQLYNKDREFRKLKGLRRALFGRKPNRENRKSRELKKA